MLTWVWVFASLLCAQLRVQPSIDFYQDRIPKYALQRYTMRFVILFCTMAATLASSYGDMFIVVGVVSLSAAMTSWTEFSDVASKTERYTRAVFALTNLLSWWNSLSPVEKASTGTISHLIHTAEAVISDERLAWLSTASKHNQQETGSRLDDESKGDGSKNDASLSA